MTPHFDTDQVQVWHGDCIEVMRELPDCSVDAVVTDPPYALNFMGKTWDSPATMVGQAPNLSGGLKSGNATGYGELRSQMHLFQAWCEQWAAEALRVLKPGGHLLAFGGTRTFHRLTAGIEDAGFEIRDSIAWMYGSGFPKSLDVSKAIDKARTEDDAPTRTVAAYLDTALKASPLTQRQAEMEEDAS